MNTRSETSPCGRGAAFTAPALLALGFAIVYALTAQRGVSWGDSGLFQSRILDGDAVGSAGLALAHPLYVTMAHFAVRMFPPSCQAWFMNAFSGLWGALAVGGMFACAMRLTHSVRAAVLAAVSLGCAHMFWWLSAMSEVYTLSVFLLACETYFLLAAIQTRSMVKLGAALLANGVHLGVHNFALISLPVEIAAAIWLWTGAARGGRTTAAAVLACGLAAWCAGAMPMLSLAAERYSASGSLVDSAMDLLVGRYGMAVAGRMGVPVRVTLFNFALAAMSLTLPCWFLAARRLINGRLRTKGKFRPEILFLGAMLLLHFVFWVRYRVSDQATFVLPTLFLALLAASGLFTGIRRPLAWGCATVASAVAVPCAVVAALSPHAGTLLHSRAELPFRDDLRYFALPWKHGEDSAMRFAEAAEKELPQDALVLADPTAEGPLGAARRIGLLRKNITLSNCVPAGFRPKTCWEVRPFGAYRLSPPGAKAVRRGTFYEVALP